MLKLQYFGHLMQSQSLEKILMLGKIEGRRRRGWQRIRRLGSITESMDMSVNKSWEVVKDREAWHAVVHRVLKVRHDWMTEQQEEPIQWKINQQLKKEKKRTSNNKAQNLKSIMLSKISQVDKIIYSITQLTWDPNTGKFETVLCLQILCSGSEKYKNRDLRNGMSTG